MKDKRGYTLIELLVVISIVAILTITIGVGSQAIRHSADKTDGRDTLGKLFNAARTYSELNNVPDGCNLCSKSNGSSCTISLDCLIKQKLLDKTIKEDYNPLMKEQTDENKLGVSTYTLTVNITDKVKYASFVSGTKDGIACGVTDTDLYDSSKKESVNAVIGECE